YMPPEQASVGARGLTPRGDIFALGCVLFECLAGRPAFAGDSVVEVLSKILLEEAPRLCDLRGDIPPALSELVAAMLSKAPGDRPADGAAAAEALAGVPAPAGARPAALGAGERRLLC